MYRKHEFKKLAPYFSQKIKNAILRISESDADRIHEIRLRINRPVTAASYGKEIFLMPDGSLSASRDGAITADRHDLESSFRAICDYSLHSYEKELSEGYITLEGGCRVGIAGTFSSNGAVKYVNGLNFRVPGQVFGCGEGIYNMLLSRKPVSILIAGSPASGKTTILKDLCRILGERYRVSVADERSEIAASFHGEPENSIGLMTDVFDGCPKGRGIETAVRVMSPDIVVCDEIGGKGDSEALMLCLNCGVKVIATVHAGSWEELSGRRHIMELVKNRVFDYAVFLGSGKNPGEIVSVKRIGDKFD